MNTTTNAVYRYIVHYINRVGYPPSYREIARACNLASISSVTYHLRQLQAANKIKVAPNRSRAIQVINAESEGQRLAKERHLTVRRANERYAVQKRLRRW